MKILHVCPRYYPHIGGVEEHVRNICERLADKHQVCVASTDPSGKLPDSELVNGVEVTRFKSWAPGEAYFVSHRLKRYLKEVSSKYEIVHSHSYHALPALYASQTKGENRLVFTPHYHGTGHTQIRKLLHVPYSILGKRIFRQADSIVCVSSYERKILIHDFEIDQPKLNIIPNGVDSEEFAQLGENDKRRTILYVGRLEEYKGTHYLIQVLTRLDKDISLEVVGRGPYKEDLVRLANKLQVAHRVNFYDGLTRRGLLEEYSSAGVFALLSRREAYGLTVAEALSAGTQCIVADTSALSEWIDNENCFGLEYPIDLDALAALITHSIGRRAHGIGIQDWNHVTSQILSLYESLLAKV